MVLLQIDQSNQIASFGIGDPAESSSKCTRNYWATLSPRDYVVLPDVKPLEYLAQTRLIREAQQGDLAARNKVWVHNARLVLSVANRLNIPRELIADILQEGTIGICIAIRKFDIERYGELSTYAWWWIKQRMMRSLHHQRFRTHVPTHLYADYCRFKREFRERSLRNDWFDWFVDQVAASPTRYQTFRQLQSLHDVSALANARRIACDGSDPVATAWAKEFDAFMQSCLNELDERERCVLSRRYGLDGGQEMTLEEVGQELSVTRERIRQVQKNAEEHLRRVILRRARSLENLGLLRERSIGTSGLSNDDGSGLGEAHGEEE
ncbi:MAG: sigma-70 family RNA polymerase sigma factor [Tepidisphaeraceae bacterium]